MKSIGFYKEHYIAIPTKHQLTDSVIIAEGSEISVDWKRKKLSNS
jgi:hypothetical protein